MKLYKLNKIVLSIRNNPAAFLNGITSNSLDRPRNAFLNIHGRIIAVFDQVQVGEDEFWVVVEPAFVGKLLSHIDRYLKLSGTVARTLDKRTYFASEDRAEIISVHGTVIPQRKGHLLISDNALEASEPDDAFTLLRLRHQMPLQGVDFTDEFVLNVSAEDFVSFTKGCFLGQEPVSKVHNRSKPTWQLAVKYENECDEESRAKMTSKVLDPDTKRVLGFTFIRNNTN